MSSDKERTDLDAERAEREASFSRREILRMGWTVPVVTAVSLSMPNAAFAQTVHTDHSDIHDDQPHVDHNDHDDHSDVHDDHLDGG